MQRPSPGKPRFGYPGLARTAYRSRRKTPETAKGFTPGAHRTEGTPFARQGSPRRHRNLAAPAAPPVRPTVRGPQACWRESYASAGPSANLATARARGRRHTRLLVCWQAGRWQGEREGRRVPEAIWRFPFCCGHGPRYSPYPCEPPTPCGRCVLGPSALLHCCAIVPVRSLRYTIRRDGFAPTPRARPSIASAVPWTYASTSSGDQNETP